MARVAAMAAARRPIVDDECSSQRNEARILPSLSDALARRAAIFGGQQLDAYGFLEPAPIPEHFGFWCSLGTASRDAVVTLAELRSVGLGA